MGKESELSLVGEAVEYAIGGLIGLEEDICRLQHRPIKRGGGFQSEWFLYNATNEKCEAGSEYVVDYLVKNRLEQFRAISLIRTDQGPFAVKRWNRHQVFVANDTEGVWHLGSASNYDMSSEGGRLRRVYSSGSLAEAMKQLQIDDGGIWPSADFIREALSTHSNASPVLTETPYGSCYEGIRFLGQRILKEQFGHSYFSKKSE